MSSSQALYTQIFAKLRTLHPDTHLTRVANWVWVIVGLIQARSVHLSEIANHIPGPAKAAGRIMKIRRWLKNKHITSRTFYEPIIQHVGSSRVAVDEPRCSGGAPRAKPPITIHIERHSLEEATNIS